VKPIEDAERALEWIRAAARLGDDFTGFDAHGWERSVWILHAMYETHELPGGLSHEDIRRIEEAAGTRIPEEDPLKDVISTAVATEGSLDHEQFVRLLSALAAVETAGEVFAFYGKAASGDFDTQTLFYGELDGLLELYRDQSLPGSPSNFWPVDRSWFIYTDYDLWATKISGSKELIDALSDDDELETVTLPC
jgi:hypothetical protein